MGFGLYALHDFIMYFDGNQLMVSVGHDCSHDCYPRSIQHLEMAASSIDL